MGDMTSRSARNLFTAGALGLALTLAACGGGGPRSVSPSPGASATSTTTGPSKEAAAGPTLDLTVQGNDIEPSNQQIKAKPGDTLVVKITSDRAGVLHVHSSPEQELDFKPGNSQVKVPLEQPGQVDIEEHVSDTLVARVLVK
jgi:hypothetical protein